MFEIQIILLILNKTNKYAYFLYNYNRFYYI